MDVVARGVAFVPAVPGLAPWGFYGAGRGRPRQIEIATGDIPGRERFSENQDGRLCMLIGLA